MVREEVLGLPVTSLQLFQDSTVAYCWLTCWIETFN
jgi:hypothetical protein